MAGNSCCSAMATDTLVVTLLDTEVAGQTAAATEPLQGGAGLLEQPRIRAPTHHRVVVAVRLGDDLLPVQARWCPARCLGQQLGQRVGGLGHRRRTAA